MKEIWKDIPNFEGYYQVSNLGNVRSVERIIKCRDGRTSNYPSKQLKQTKDKRGYSRVGLSVNGRRTTHGTHRLVAETFLVKPEIKLISVNHIDGIKANNQLDNLEWVTYSENTKKGYDIGLFDKAREATKERLKNNTYRCKSVEVTFKDTGITKNFKSAREASRYINRCQNYFTQLLRIGGENKYYKVRLLTKQNVEG